jgi:hypothetical protein
LLLYLIAVARASAGTARPVTDHDNALVHCREIVEMQGTGDATDLCRRMAKRAADLVAANQVIIRRVAHRLDEVGEMTGEQIEATLLEG